MVKPTKEEIEEAYHWGKKPMSLQMDSDLPIMAAAYKEAINTLNYLHLLTCADVTDDRNAVVKRVLDKAPEEL